MTQVVRMTVEPSVIPSCWSLAWGLFSWLPWKWRVNGVFSGESKTKLTHQMVQDLVPWPDSSGTPDDCLELGHVHLEQAEKINIMSKIFLWYNKKDQWNAHVVQGAVQLVDGVAMLEDNLHFSWKGVVLSVVVSEVSFFTWFLSFAC